MTQIDRFWKLLADSGLVTVARLAQLQADFQQLRGAARANPPVLAQWLISEGLMTGYHASVLLKGRPGPFFYGDFLVRDIHLAGRLAGTFPAVHQPTGHPVLLVFFGQNQSADPVSWAATVAWGAECFPLDVPQLATCHELVDTGDFRFAVLDDLHGAALAESLQDGRALSVPRAAGLIYDVAQALHTLHTAGHAHGDLSPQNILQNGSGHGQLLYFPLSRSDHTRAAPLDLQRANYAAPELNPQQPMPTPAADMYALGCTLYHALAGNPPFPEPDANVAQKMARHAAQPVVPLHQQNAVPPQVSQIVSRMMAKDLSNRYVDAGSVLAALGPWVDPARTPALPPAATRGRYLAVAKRRRSTPAPAGAAATRAAPQPQSLTAAQPVTDLPIATAAGAQPAVAVDGFAPSVESPLAGQMVLPKGGSTKGPQPWWQKRTNRNNLIVAGSVALIALLLLPMAISKWPKRE
ncbi:MAG: protein kinase, partial [Planctomycetales bacterium]|nr:protein kinase [Planctomycetales bacterium]NIM07664.1 protein kinase [Planctomycetales bacterium]NIN07169.1 protein kinase [Planctomycetales bacterium]NIN76262.1 protein kinase [Planctomycetales bacterium]NIO33478.1 protein kinase [Planctomycetales bacterium]